jgi:hypothetical protein
MNNNNNNNNLNNNTRDKLLKVAKELNIPLPKGKYIKNDDLKTLITEFVNRKQIRIKKSTKKRSPINLVEKLKNKGKTHSLKQQKYKVDIKKSVFPKVKKLVAIGDIHGDLPAAIKALKLAKVIDPYIPNNTTDINKIHWVGGKTVVVQLGDQIDRVRPGKLINDLCPSNDSEINQDEGSDLKIIYLFEKLHTEAMKAGGALFSILGNHELMNVDGDFRYVSPKEFKEFGTFFKEDSNLCKQQNLPYGYLSRLQVFKPGGIISKKLAQSRYSILQVGSWLFVHGGITPKLASEYTIDNVNRYIQDWLMGHDDIQTLTNVKKIYHRDDDENSPFWSRKLSDCDEWNNSSSSNEFYKTLDILNKKNRTNNSIKGMILGHSPQYMYNKGLNSACNNRLWRVDVGMSRAFGLVNNKDSANRKVQILVINNDNEFQIFKEQ